MLGLQNLCRKAFESIFTKDLVFDLDVKNIFHGIDFFESKPPGGQSGMD
jgi:hypothetical protein